MDRIGDLTGEISRAAAGLTVNVNNSQNTIHMSDPLIVQLQAGLLRCLAKHPAARADVIVMLSELEAAEYQPAKPIGNGHAMIAPPMEIEAVTHG